MEIIFNSLYKIDIEAKSITFMPQIQGRNDLDSYVMELVTNILESSDKKGYKFQSSTTEVRRLLDDILKNPVSDTELYDKYAKTIAERLLEKEINSQNKVQQLGIVLLKGIVVVSLIKFDNDTYKIVISKADHDDFIDSASYLKRSGLPLKKKIYKAFIAEYDNRFNVTRTSVYDTNSTFSVYWWRDFLELEEVYNSAYNTKLAFKVIEDKILTPVKQVSRPDYNLLWNTTVHYFNTKNEFSLEEYINDIIKPYEPVNEKVDIGNLVNKASNLADKNKFDSRFEITKGLLKKRFKRNIELTPQIDLVIKQDFDIKNIIKTKKEDDGSKWLMIKTDKGYNEFETDN